MGRCHSRRQTWWSLTILGGIFWSLFLPFVPVGCVFSLTSFYFFTCRNRGKGRQNFKTREKQRKSTKHCGEQKTKGLTKPSKPHQHKIHKPKASCPGFECAGHNSPAITRPIEQEALQGLQWSPTAAPPGALRLQLQMLDKRPGAPNRQRSWCKQLQ